MKRVIFFAVSSCLATALVVTATVVANKHITESTSPVVPSQAMATYRKLVADPPDFLYPFTTEPNQVKDTTLVLTNIGNETANYTRTISYTDGAGWLSFPNDSAYGSVPAGSANSDTLLMRVVGPPLEGLYKATIRFAYDNGSGPDTLVVNVELYDFRIIYDCFPGYFHTATNKLFAHSNSRVAQEYGNTGFKYFSDGKNYLTDGSLIIGNAANKMSWATYGTYCPESNESDHGTLFPLTGDHIDSTGYFSYMYQTGKGCNGDSTIAFTSEFYAPKHADSSEFYIAHFDIYAGPNWAGNITNLAIGYSTDWDVPSDSGFAVANRSGYDVARQTLYQYGLLPNGQNNGRYGAIACLEDKMIPAIGGFIREHNSYWASGYNPDSLWNSFTSVNGFSKTNKVGDLATFIVAKRGVTLGANDTISFSIILAAQNGGSLAGLQRTVDKARMFIATHVNAFFDCMCGDVDGNGTIDISDAVCLISYIFMYPNCQPAHVCQMDADGSGSADISDAVYLISFIFAGGPAPHCP